ncbi:MAG: hypothetical protein ACTHOE_16535 [Conexibacter sp.]
MAVTETPQNDRMEQRLSELEREERELEQRTDGYQWNHAISLVASGLALLLALAAVVIAVNADHHTSVATPASMAGAMAGATSSASAGAQGGAAASAALPTKRVTLTMKPDAKVGSDGDKHDATLPADFSVRAGQSVRLTIYNYDDMPHSFTSPGLARGAAIPAAMQQMQGTADDLKVMPMAGMGVNQTIPGSTGGHAAKTVITFTAPSKAGTYIWYCRLPCDAWAMAHDGYMRGHVTVTSA